MEGGGVGRQLAQRVGSNPSCYCGEWETEGNCSPECCSYLEVQLGRAALYFFFVSDLAIFMAR